MFQSNLHKIILKHYKTIGFEKCYKLHILTSNLKLQSSASSQQCMKFDQCMTFRHEEGRILQLVGDNLNSETVKRKMRYQLEVQAINDTVSDWHNTLILTSIDNLAANMQSITSHSSCSLLTIPFIAVIQFSNMNCQIAVINNSKGSCLVLNLEKYSWTSCCLMKNRSYNWHGVYMDWKLIRLLCTSYKNSVRTCLL